MSAAQAGPATINDASATGLINDLFIAAPINAQFEGIITTKSCGLAVAHQSHARTFGLALGEFASRPRRRLTGRQASNDRFGSGAELTGLRAACPLRPQERTSGPLSIYE